MVMFEYIHELEFKNFINAIIGLLVCLLAIGLQILSIALWLITILSYPVFLVVWLIFGLLLQTTKLIAVGSLSNYWFVIWTGKDSFMDPNLIVDRSELISSLVIECIFESIPQIIIQCVNNTYMDYWSTLALFSLIFSSLFLVNATWWYLKTILDGIFGSKPDNDSVSQTLWNKMTEQLENVPISLRFCLFYPWIRMVVPSESKTDNNNENSLSWYCCCAQPDDDDGNGQISDQTDSKKEKKILGQWYHDEISISPSFCKAISCCFRYCLGNESVPGIVIHVYDITLNEIPLQKRKLLVKENKAKSSLNKPKFISSNFDALSIFETGKSNEEDYTETSKNVSNLGLRNLSNNPSLALKRGPQRGSSYSRSHGTIVPVDTEGAQRKEEEEEIEGRPQHTYYCGITGQPIQDAVIAADGEIYERSNILAHFETSDKSPVHNTQMEHKILKNLKANFIEESLKRGPRFK